MIDYVAEVSYTDDHATYKETIAVLGPNAKDSALYKLIAADDALDDFAQYLPKETESFYLSAGGDLNGLYEFVKGTLHAGGPAGEELWAKWLDLQKQIGFDVERDLLSWVGGGMVNVTLAGGKDSVFMLEVRDEDVAREKVGAALEFGATQLMELAAQNPMLAMMSVRTSPVADEALEGFEHIYFAMSPQPLVWGVRDGYLIFGSSARATKLCLETGRGEHPNIRENERVMSELILPDGPFDAMSLTDQRRLGKDMSELIGMMSMGVGMAGAFIPDKEAKQVVMRLASIAQKFVPVVQKIDFIKSTATCTTFDGAHWRTKAVTHYFSPAERGGGGEHP